MPIPTSSVEVLELEVCVCCGSAETVDDSAAARVIGLYPPYSIRRCRPCGMRWQSPRPTRRALEGLYEVDYFAEAGTPGQLAKYGAPPGKSRRFDAAAEGRAEHAAERHLMNAESLLGGPGSLLEVGVGRGVFLRTAAARGWQASGIEPSEQGVDAAKSFGLDVEQATLENYSTNRRFDLVFAGHVLEHLESPIAGLEAMRELLSGRGVVIVEVPNQFDALGARASNVARRVMGRPRLSSIYSVHHLSFFGAAQLAMAMQAAGLDAEVHSPTVGATKRRSMTQAARLGLSDLGTRLGVGGDILVGVGGRG